MNKEYFVFKELVKTYLEMYSFQEPRLEVEIIEEVLENKKNSDELKKVVEWLCNKKPIQYYSGYTYTMGYKININEHVMIPGPEMDIFIGTVQKYLKNCQRVMELCTGSGVIPVVLGIKNKKINFFASDISCESLKVAQSNVEMHGLNNVKLLEGNLFEPFEKSSQFQFDVLVSNPPYAKSGDIKNLITQLKDNAPRISLDGGADGLYFYREILKDVHKYLKNGGYIIFENGEGQSEILQSILITNGFKIVEVVKDHININRFIVAQLEENEA